MSIQAPQMRIETVISAHLQVLYAGQHGLGSLPNLIPQFQSLCEIVESRFQALCETVEPQIQSLREIVDLKSKLFVRLLNPKSSLFVRLCPNFKLLVRLMFP